MNLTRLQTSARLMMAMCGWKNSVYWSSTSTNPKNIPTRIVVRVAYFENLNLVGFNFCKYHPDAVELVTERSVKKWGRLPTLDVDAPDLKAGASSLPHFLGSKLVRSLPSNKRYFYKVTLNKYTSFKIWCIDGQHFDFVVAQLQQYADIKLEFVVSHQDRGLIVPESFTQLGLTFYQRGNKC